MHTYDVLIIGSGPGGYTCAIRNAQLGKKVAIIEKYSKLGGTCLNIGCIPSKALLDSSEKYNQTTSHLQSHGISTSKISIDFNKMIARKDNIISQTATGIEYLMNKNKIKMYTGTASFIDINTIQLNNDASQILTATNIVIATGSRPTPLPFADFDKKRIISSTEALSLPVIPKTMLIIGSGAIGLELGSVYSRLGTKIKIVEFLDKITPNMDEMISKELLRVLKKQGISFFLNTNVTKITNTGKSVLVEATNSQTNIVKEEVDYCLVAVGRRPFTEGLGLEKIGITLDKKGFISVDKELRTSIPTIFAIGDVAPGVMLAHKAEEEGVFVAEIIDGQKPYLDHFLIPGVIYTSPEAASVGATEESLKTNQKAYKVGKYSLKALGRAKVSDETDGIVKILADEKTDEVLGVHIVSARAADLIAEATIAMTFRASAEDIGRICHAHPTFAEAIKEAALDATEKRSINA